jgi:hypothetical protein
LTFKFAIIEGQGTLPGKFVIAPFEGAIPLGRSAVVTGRGRNPFFHMSAEKLLISLESEEIVG